MHLGVSNKRSNWSW